MPAGLYSELNPTFRKFSLDRQATVWRYMDIGKFLDLITTGKLWFTRVSELRKSDPFEGGLTTSDDHKTKEILEARSREDLLTTLNQHREFDIAALMNELPERTHYFFQLMYKTQRLPYFNLAAYMYSISCWHQNPRESDAMWALYAQRDAGVAIKSTVERLLRAFQDTERSLSIGRVIYDGDDTISAMDSGIYGSLFIKRHAFSHENEVRIIAPTSDGYEQTGWTNKNRIYTIDPSRNVPPGYYIDCNLQHLIEEVVISPLMAPYIARAIEHISGIALGSIPVRRSNLHTREMVSLDISPELHSLINYYDKTKRLRDIDAIGNAGEEGSIASPK